MFDKQPIVSSSIKAIILAHPHLDSFMEKVKIEERFNLFLDDLKTLLNGQTLSEEELEQCKSLAVKLGQQAVADFVDVDVLIHCTFLFRQTFWNYMEINNGVFSKFSHQQTLHTVQKLNEYLSQINLIIIQEYLEKERQVVAMQQKDLVDRQKRLDLDLQLARKIQQSMFPAHCQFGAFKLCAQIIPSGAVGGDFYGVLPFGHPASRVDLYIGDVQGKGVAAALIMMVMNSILWNVALNETSPQQIIMAANRRFRQHITEELSQFVSLFYLSYDVKTRRLAYAKAGHEDGIFVRHKDKKLNTLSTAGYFLGIFDEMDCEEKYLTVEPGDRLYLFTDGISVIANTPGKSFEYEEFFEIIMRHSSCSIGNTLEKIFLDLMKLHGEGRLKDDVGLLVVEF